jgi:GH24 family phage-related lysozyme (muramidase)
MSNANLSFNQQGLILLKRDEGVIEGLYDDDSDYCTSGVGHLVHTKDKWASFLLAAASADSTWKRLVAQSGRTRYLPQATAFNPDFAKIKGAAVVLAREKIAQARLKAEYPKLTPTQSVEVDALAVAAVEAESVALAQPIDVALRADLIPFERTVRQSVTSTLSQDEFDALVSFAFNVGAGAFAGSTLLTKINTDKHLSGTRKEREAGIDEVNGADSHEQRRPRRRSPSSPPS